MDYQDLHQRYGSHIAKRVKAELHHSEFNQVDLGDLVAYLEIRAEAAHKEYHLRLDDPLGKSRHSDRAEIAIDHLHRRWRDAEEISYLVTVAEDVSLSTRAHLTAG